MRVLIQMSRRTMLAGKAALAGLAALPGLAQARVAAPPEASAPVVPATAPDSPRPPRWHDATAEELAALVGDRFRASSPEHGSLVLKLTAVEAGQSGAARPAHLPRREGVTALFDSPDAEALKAAGDGTLRLWHPRMGSADLYVTAVPRRSGGADIEVVLN